MSKVFAAIRRGHVKPGMADEFAKRVREGALSVMRTMHGFKAYYLVKAADGSVIAMQLFDNAESAAAATSKLMPWIKENLGPLLDSPTEPTDGEVVIAEVM